MLVLLSDPQENLVGLPAATALSWLIEPRGASAVVAATDRAAYGAVECNEEALFNADDGRLGLPLRCCRGLRGHPACSRRPGRRRSGSCRHGACFSSRDLRSQARAIARQAVT